MHVIHAIPRLDPKMGGTVAAVRQMVVPLARRGVRVSLVTHRESAEADAEAARLRDAGVAVHLIDVPRWQQWGPWTILPAPNFTRKIAELLRRLTPDLVHVHGVWENLQHYCAVACREARLPLFWSPHGMLDAWSLTQSRVKKRVVLAVRTRRDLRTAAVFHATTASEAAHLRRLLPSAKVVEVPLGLDLVEFDPQPPRGWLRRHVPTFEGRPTAMLMSRLHYKKGFDRLLPAFRKVLDGWTATDGPRPALFIAGPDGGEGSRIRNLLRTLRLHDDVILHGMIHGRERILALADADLFVLPSYQENFGIVVVEAMAAGVPVLVTPEVAVSDAVTALAAGETVPAADYAARLAYWLRDAGARAAAGRAARAGALETFDPDKIAARWAGIYSDVLPGIHDGGGQKPVGHPRRPAAAV